MIYIKNNEEIDSEPKCSHADGHAWESPYSIVGGCKENPGVWSLGGTKMSFRECCSHCGLYKVEKHLGSQRNPGEEDSATYEDADERSEAWVAEQE